MTSSDPLEDVSVTFPLIAQGGGIYVSDGTVTIADTTISGNTASGYVRLLSELSWNLPPGTPWKKFP